MEILIVNYGNILINENSNIFIKNINSNKIYDIQKIVRYGEENITVNFEFTTYSNKIIIEDGNLKIIISTVIAPAYELEVKQISIYNKGIQDVKLEITTYEEMILQQENNHKAHPSFDNMFIDYEYKDSYLLLTRKIRMQNEKKVYVAKALINKYGSNFEFETDKENYIDINSYPFKNDVSQNLNPIVAMRKIIDVKSEEEEKVYLLTSAYEEKNEAEEAIQEYEKEENLRDVFELAKSQTEAQTRYLGIEEKNINVYADMLEYILYPEEKEGKNIEDNFEDDKLWKYGISGDFPIIVLRIKQLNDLYVVKEIFKAYEYFKSKKVLTEFVIITTNEMKNVVIANDEMQKLLGKRAGIFVLSDYKKEDKKAIEGRASLIFDAKNGAIKMQIKELKDRLKKRDKENANNQKKKETIALHQISNEEIKIECDYEKLNYENEIGAFNEDFSEYWIRQNDELHPPVAWSNIMANEKFGTVITNNMGGYTWYKNCKTNRIIDYDNDAISDNSNEKLYLKDIKRANENYVCNGFGYTRYIKSEDNIFQNLTVFVPIIDSVKVYVETLKNEAKKSKTCTLKYDAKFLLGEKESKSIISTKYKENLNMVLIKNNINPKYYAYVTSNEKINENMEISFTLKPKEKRTIVVVLGAEETEIECVDVSTKYTTNYHQEFKKTKKYWIEKVQRICSNTPMKNFDAIQNGFLVYQSIVSRLLAKTGFYQSSGGYGFRDQLQDAMGMKWVDSDILKNQILLHANHQFLEGDVEHWWHSDSNLGIRARYSDDLLFLPYAVLEYIDFTGDYSILDENAKYIEEKELTEDENDRVKIFYPSEKEGTIFEHCIKAINKASVLGNHSLPLIKCGDWNDGMNQVGNKGKGESVWLGFFLYDILERFAEIINHRIQIDNKKNISKDMTIGKEDEKEGPTNIEELEQADLKNKYLDLANKIKKALNTDGWDGRWFRRAFTDDGKIIGSIENDECKIDSICQSFAVISNAADNDKKYIALESLEEYLIDNNNNIVKLLTPPLVNENLGYITSYGKGMRENGGQYTHAAIWALLAESMLNRKEAMFNIYKKINPLEHTKTLTDVKRYKVEPYVIAGDIFSEGKLAGRGGWTWYTGSSAWLYEAQIRYILGIRIKDNKMSINPVVPDDWKEFQVHFKWKDATYNLNYKKGSKYMVDSKNELKIKNKSISLKETGIYNINIII